MPAALDHRIGHGDADLGPPVRHRGHPPLSLVEHRLARQQRGGMAVGPDPEQGDVEQRLLRIEHRRAVSRLQGPLVAQGGLVGSAIGRHGVNVFPRYRRLGEHRLAGHPVVALRMIVGNEALVAPIPGYAPPREATAELIGGQQPVERLGGRAAGERDPEGAPGPRALPPSSIRRHRARATAGPEDTSMRPIILLMSSPQSDAPRMKRSTALAKPSSL